MHASKGGRMGKMECGVRKKGLVRVRKGGRVRPRDRPRDRVN